MSLPAARDCELNDELVARVLREQFPAHAPHAVRYLGAGWDHVAYELNAQWIVRMPMRASVAARVPIELGVLELARAVLPLELPVIELRGRPSALYPYPFSGYRKLPGVIAQHAPLERWCTRDNARVLGAALGALHTIAIERARVAGVLDASASEHSCRGRAERVRRAQPRMQAALGRERARRCAAFLAQRPLIAAGAGARVLRHDDLHLEHLLLDAGMQRVTGMQRITGIIDWTDASIGDPAAEFVALWLSCGEAFVRDVLDAYPGPSDAGMLERIRIRARWSTLDWLARSLERDPQRIAARFADFERAFAER